MNYCRMRFINDDKKLEHYYYRIEAKYIGSINS